MRLTKRIAAFAISAALGLGTFPGTALAQPLKAQSIPLLRIEGETRYDTMANIVSSNFTRSPWAVVATGMGFPDALSASPLAGARNCPIILSSPDSLSAQAKQQLTALGVKDAYILGGTAALSGKTESDIEALGITTHRVFGADRALTSVDALEAVRDSGSRSDTIIVATGANYADALSISPWAWATASPIVLASSNGLLADEVVDAIQDDAYVERIVVVGGTSAVSELVEDQLGSSYSYERLAGANRYLTSSAVAAWETSDAQGFSWSSPTLATGLNFPDALAGSVLPGINKSPLLLADSIGDPTMAQLLEHQLEVTQGYILGGESALSLPLDDMFRVDDYAAQVLAEVGGTGIEGLRNAFDYIIDMPYRDGDCYPGEDWVSWSIPYAEELYTVGSGNCYRYSALLCWVARHLGFDARAVDGNVPTMADGSMSAHGWTEITIDGVRYVCDCDLQKFIPDRDFFMQTYDEAPIQYYTLDEIPY